VFKTGPLYLANLNSTAEIVVNQGGTSSGKTYSILQALFSIAVREKAEITVVGQDIPNLKRGALRDSQNTVSLSEDLSSLIKSYNATERIFSFHSGSIIEFVSYANAQDAKNGKRDYLFCNELQGISWEVFVELAMMGRTRKRTFVDYNPNSRFWVHDKVIPMPTTQLLISDHRHNPFLEQKTRDKIEGLKDIDYELWKVYARGMTGKIEGLIFRNWDVVDSVPKEATKIGTGLDFGYTNDPTAAVDVYKMNNELWVDLQEYATGLTNPDIAERLKALGITTNVVADSAEPKSIAELRAAGVWVEPAMKGKDSVTNSIDILKRFKIHVTSRSIKLITELNSYKWKIDKLTGNPVNEPVDFLNHAIDALRYIALNKLTHYDNSYSIVA
jgi:phage terminase large subunit